MSVGQKKTTNLKMSSKAVERYGLLLCRNTDEIGATWVRMGRSFDSPPQMIIYPGSRMKRS